MKKGTNRRHIRRKMKLIPKGTGMFGLVVVIGALIGSDILLDKMINLVMKLLGAFYPAFVLKYISAYDLTLMIIVVVSISLILYEDEKGGKK